MSTQLNVWVRLTLVTFVLLIVIHLALPALLLLLQIPSFFLGNETLWIVRWENTSSRTGIEFNMMALLAIALVVGGLGVLLRFKKRSR